MKNVFEFIFNQKNIINLRYIYRYHININILYPNKKANKKTLHNSIGIEFQIKIPEYCS